jgi:hypothetical protein
VVMGIFRVCGVATVLGLVWTVVFGRQRGGPRPEAAAAGGRMPEQSVLTASGPAKEEGA